MPSFPLSLIIMIQRTTQTSLILLLTLWPLVSWGQPAGYGSEFDDEQLPTPLYEREQQVEEAPERETRIDPSSPVLVPSAALGASFSFTDEEIDKPGLTLWFGGTFYPAPATITPFIGAGLEVEAYFEIASYPTDFVPQLKIGVAWLPGAPSAFKNQLLPNLQVYALGGWRMSMLDNRPNAIRAGIGISSPAMSPAAAFMLLYGVPIPTQMEIAVDLNPATRTQDWWIQFGIGF